MYSRNLQRSNYIYENYTYGYFGMTSKIAAVGDSGRGHGGPINTGCVRNEEFCVQVYTLMSINSSTCLNGTFLFYFFKDKIQASTETFCIFCNNLIRSISFHITSHIVFCIGFGPHIIARTSSSPENQSMNPQNLPCSPPEVQGTLLRDE